MRRGRRVGWRVAMAAAIVGLLAQLHPQLKERN
jgi:hypothetical protein